MKLATVPGEKTMMISSEQGKIWEEFGKKRFSHGAIRSRCKWPSTWQSTLTTHSLTLCNLLLLLRSGIDLFAYSAELSFVLLCKQIEQLVDEESKCTLPYPWCCHSPALLLLTKDALRPVMEGWPVWHWSKLYATGRTVTGQCSSTIRRTVLVGESATARNEGTEWRNGQTGHQWSHQAIGSQWNRCCVWRTTADTVCPQQPLHHTDMALASNDRATRTLAASAAAHFAVLMTGPACLPSVPSHWPSFCRQAEQCCCCYDATPAKSDPMLCCP